MNYIICMMIDGCLGRGSLEWEPSYPLFDMFVNTSFNLFLHWLDHVYILFIMLKQRGLYSELRDT